MNFGDAGGGGHNAADSIYLREVLAGEKMSRVLNLSALLFPIRQSKRTWGI